MTRSTVQATRAHRVAGRRRTALVAGLVTVGLLLLAAASARAARFEYCNKMVASHSRCDSPARPDHSWERNSADAPWTGQAWAMCERITATNDYTYVYSRVCRTALKVTGYWDDRCGGCYGHNNPGYVIRAWVGNDAGQPRIIRGVAEYGVF
jgi:hypothetical protein